MFLNKCLLFKEIQLHLEQFSTCKESVQAVGKVISLSEQLQGFLIKESSSGLFSSPSASPVWMVNPGAWSVEKASLFYTLAQKKTMQRLVLLNELLVFSYTEAKLSGRVWR